MYGLIGEYEGVLVILSELVDIGLNVNLQLALKKYIEYNYICKL